MEWSGANSGMPSGRYVLSSRGPPRSGQNLLVVSADVQTVGAAGATSTLARATNGSVITVPAGGVAGVTFLFTWPSSLATGNWGDATLTSLDSAATGQNTTSGGAATKLGCSDVAEVWSRNSTLSLGSNPDKLTPDDRETWKGCPEGQARVWVFSNAAAFTGANFTWVSTQRPNATRCVAPPRYDAYTQQLSWKLEWDFSCWANATAMPVAIMTEIAERGMTAMPMGDTRIAVRSPLSGQTIGASSVPVLQPFISVSHINATANNYTTYNVTYDKADTVGYLLPVANISLAVLLQGLPSAVSPSYASFLVGTIQTATTPKPDINALRKGGATIIDWGARLVLAGNKSEAQLIDVAFLMGAQAVVSLEGWKLSSRLLLRDYSLLYDCRPASLSGLLDAVAAVGSLNRTQLSANCTALPPGKAADLGYGRRRLSQLVDDGAKCGDARLVVDVTWEVAAPGAPVLVDRTGSAVLQELLGAVATTPATPTTNATATNSTSNSTSTTNSTQGSAAGLLEGYTLSLGWAVAGALKQLAGPAGSDLFCTIPSDIATLVSVASSMTSSARNAQAATQDCASAAVGAADLLKAFLAGGYGSEAGVDLVSVTRCSYDFECRDNCWNYPLTQWQLVLIACAGVVVIVAVLALRIAIVRSMAARRRAPPGQLDTAALIKTIEMTKADKVAASQDFA